MKRQFEGIYPHPSSNLAGKVRQKLIDDGKFHYHLDERTSRDRVINIIPAYNLISRPISVLIKEMIK